MRCPFCGVNDDKVIDSREGEGARSIRRRRECKACGKRYTTFETVEQKVSLLVIKRDQSRVPYERRKVISGFEKACYKRPVSAGQITLSVDQVEEELFRRGVKEIESTEIGRLCIEHLKRLDHVAYVRFASVYLKISNIDDLLEEMQEVKQAIPLPPGKDQGQLF